MGPVLTVPTVAVEPYATNVFPTTVSGLKYIEGISGSIASEPEKLCENRLVSGKVLTSKLKRIF